MVDGIPHMLFLCMLSECVCTCLGVCTCMWRSEVNLSFVPQEHLCLFHTGSLSGLELAAKAVLAREPEGPSCLCLLVLFYLAFLHGFLGLNPSSHACKVSPALTEPPP